MVCRIILHCSLICLPNRGCTKTFTRERNSSKQYKIMTYLVVHYHLAICYFGKHFLLSDVVLLI
jgi:hypothetical protein